MRRNNPVENIPIYGEGTINRDRYEESIASEEEEIERF